MWQKSEMAMARTAREGIICLWEFVEIDNVRNINKKIDHWKSRNRKELGKKKPLSIQ